MDSSRSAAELSKTGHRLKPLRPLLFVLLALSLAWQDGSGEGDISLTPFSETLVTVEAGEAVRIPLEAEIGEVWSFTAVSVDGVVDPILRLLDEADEVLLANDDESRSSANARLENWVAAEAGTYTLELSAEQSGEVLLGAYPEADSVQYALLTPSVTLEAGQSHTLFARINPLRNPLRLDFEVHFAAGDAFQLEMRPFLQSGTGGWALRFEDETVQLQTVREEEGGFFYRTFLEQPFELEPGTYTLLIEGAHATLNQGDETVLTLEPERPGFLFLRLGLGPLLLVASSDNTEAITFENLGASAPFYDQSMPLSDALPPVSADEQLTRFEGDPLALVTELMEKGYATQEGGMVLNVPDAVIETSQPGFSTLEIRMARGIEDFILHFTARLSAGAESSACGMNFRRADSSNFGAALFTADGNAYLMSYVDGALSEESLGKSTPFIDPGLIVNNNMIVVARGDDLTLFINGVKMGSITMEDRAGTFEFTILVNEKALSRCAFERIWVWEMH
jgi:hypothetical protein